MPPSKIRNRICQQCGVPFVLGQNNRLEKYCSLTCRRRYHYLRGCVQYRNTEKGRLAATEYRLKTKFGISIYEYNQILMEQEGRCAICKTDKPTGKGTWHVDHCHTTKKVRGLLCSKCNHAIGLLGDDVSRLESAWRYIVCALNT